MSRTDDTGSRFKESIMGSNEARRQKLLAGAIEYARSLGFAPHADHRRARLLLADVDASQCAETFTFGKDGKPFYIRGPHESIAQAQSISRRIFDAGGDYVIPLGPPN